MDNGQAQFRGPVDPPYPPGARGAHVAGALALTVAGLGSASAWADAYVDPCDDPTQISIPCTTH